jgi:hypothetical protein
MRNCGFSLFFFKCNLYRYVKAAGRLGGSGEPVGAGGGVRGAGREAWKARVYDTLEKAAGRACFFLSLVSSSLIPIFYLKTPRRDDLN